MKVSLFGKWVIGATVVAAGAGALFYFSNTKPLEPTASESISSDLDFSAVGFIPEAITMAPGVHLLGKVVPGNAYAIETDDGLVLIDCGIRDDASFVIRQLEELQLDIDQLVAVFITHAHADHCQGAEYLRNRTGARIYAGAGDAAVIGAGVDRDAFFSKYTMAGLKLHPTTVDVSLKGGEVINYGAARVTAMATPGHSPGSMCYLLERNGRSMLFSGDVISSLTGELGTYITKLAPRFRGDAADYLNTIAKLRDVPVPDLLFPGHTEDDPLGQSPTMNARLWKEILDRGERELSETISNFERDGRDFLGDEPVRILTDLYYLGRFRENGMYAFVSDGEMMLFDAPSGRGFLGFLSERMDRLGISLPEQRFVCLTSCDARATANLGELVSKLDFKVVAPRAGLVGLAKRCPEDTEFIITGAPMPEGLPAIIPHQLTGIGEFPVAYEIRMNGKTVLISGRLPVEPVERSINQLHREMTRNKGDIPEFLASLRKLGGINPDIWLPSTIVNDQNANIYGNQWQEVLEKNHMFFQTPR